jgi:DNA polymerase III subunit delta'
MIGFKDIFGQDSAVRALRQAIAAERLAHGLIFVGPEGVGKATTAAALGAMFLCENPKAADACGKCQSCVAFAASAHPDYHVITKELARLHDKTGASKATQLPINVIRFELAAVAARKTTLGRGKVFVVEQADLMTAAAQNALLKTLEEPAGRTLIILLTTQAADLLPTVRSRCQTIRFAALDRDLVREELIQRGIDRSEAKTAAELSDGSLGVALRWIEDGLLAPAAEVIDSIDKTLAGKSAADLSDLLRKNADAYAEKVLARDELASKDSAVRAGLSLYLGVAARRIRESLSGGADADRLERACDVIDALARAEKYLDANVNLSLILEQLRLTTEPSRLGFVTP